MTCWRVNLPREELSKDLKKKTNMFFQNNYFHVGSVVLSANSTAHSDGSEGSGEIDILPGCTRTTFQKYHVQLAVHEFLPMFSLNHRTNSVLSVPTWNVVIPALYRLYEVINCVRTYVFHSFSCNTRYNGHTSWPFTRVDADVNT